MAFDPLSMILAPIATQVAGQAIGGFMSPQTPPMNFERYAGYMTNAINQYYNPLLERGRKEISDFYETEKTKAIKDAAARGVYSGGAIENLLAQKADKSRESAISDYVAQIESAKADAITRAILGEQTRQAKMEQAYTGRRFDLQDYMTSALGDMATTAMYPQTRMGARTSATEDTEKFYRDLILTLTAGRGTTNPFTAPAPEMK